MRSRRVASGFFAGVLAVAAALPGLAQDEPGRFDFYILSLSWSPSFCQANGERQQRAFECGDRPYAFVVHGLWPQYADGFPRSCQIPPPPLPRSIMVSMLDLMPSPRLVYHEWDEHGTCSGLKPAEYFRLVREARQAIKIPPQYSELNATLTVNPEDLRTAFIDANPRLTAESIMVDCDRKRLREVRICLNKDLSFRSCPDLVRRSCRHDVIMPPIRVGAWRSR